MVWMNEVAKLMHHNVFNTVSWHFQQPFIQRNDALLGKAGTPSGFHVPDSNLWHTDAVLLEGRIIVRHNAPWNTFPLHCEQ